MSEGNGNGKVPTFNAEDMSRFEELIRNESTLSRDALFRALLDPRRDVEAECGYPKGNPDAQFYKDLFDREAVPARVVGLFPSECWQVSPTVYEDDDSTTDTPFEEAVDGLAQELNGGSLYQDEEGSPIWEYFQRADELSGIGRFGVMLLGFDDGMPLSTPVGGVTVNGRGTTCNGKVAPGGADQGAFVANLRDITGKNLYTDGEGKPTQLMVGSTLMDSASYGTDATYQGNFTVQPLKPKRKEGTRLIYLRVYPESQVQIVQFESNLNSPRFGLPVRYLIQLTDPRDSNSAGVGLPMQMLYVHWSRVQHVADFSGQASSSEVFAVPRMRPYLNRLLDLRKLYACSAEGFWKSAFPGLSIETHPSLGGSVEIDQAGVRAMMDGYFNSTQRALVWSGMSTKSLAPVVSSPKDQIECQLANICIGMGVPMRIFQGSERGHLASSQDSGTWNDRLRARQNSYLTPRMIVPFIDRLIAVGVLPEPGGAKKSKVKGVGTDKGYSVDWPDIDQMSDAEKGAIFLQKAQAWAAIIAGNVEQLFSPMDLLTKIGGFDQEEAEAIMDAQEKSQEQKTDEQVEMGNIPAPPPGFQPAVPDVPQVGASGEDFGGADPVENAKDALGHGSEPHGGPQADKLMELSRQNVSPGSTAGSSSLSSSAVVAKVLKDFKFPKGSKITADSVAAVLEDMKVTGEHVVGGRLVFRVNDEKKLHEVLSAVAKGQTKDGRPMLTPTSLHSLVRNAEVDWEQVANGNPNHDSAGRFSSGADGGKHSAESAAGAVADIRSKIRDVGHGEIDSAVTSMKHLGVAELKDVFRRGTGRSTVVGGKGAVLKQIADALHDLKHNDDTNAPDRFDAKMK